MTFTTTHLLTSGLLAAVVLATACDGRVSEASTPSDSPAAVEGQATARGPLPPAVARQVVEWGRTIQSDYCSGDGFSARGAPSIAHTADFNADGQTDYVVGLGGMECWMDGQQAFSIYGPMNPWAVILSSPGGYSTETFDSSEAHEIEVRQLDGRDVLILSPVGPGAYERPFYTYAYGWTGSGMDQLAWYDEEGSRVTREGRAWRGTGRDTARAPASAASAALSRYLPLPIGYYAPRGGCGGDPFHLTYLGDDGISFQEMGPPCRHVSTRALGGGRQEVVTSCASEEGGNQRSTDIYVTTADGYTYGEDGQPRYLCPLSSVPASSRFRG